MSKTNKIYFYIAANLAMFIPIPGRFAFAVFVAIQFSMQMLLLTLLSHALKKIKLETLKTSILLIETVAFTILFKQLLTIYCPIAALTLGFSMYLPALTPVIMQFIFDDEGKDLIYQLRKNMAKSLTMGIFMVLYFLLRDIFGYGTIAMPMWKKIFYIHLPYNLQRTNATIFLATIPGSLIFISIILATALKIRQYLPNLKGKFAAKEEAE